MHSFGIFVGKFYRDSLVMVDELPLVPYRMLFVGFLSCVSRMLKTRRMSSKNWGNDSYLVFVVEGRRKWGGIENE